MTFEEEDLLRSLQESLGIHRWLGLLDGILLSYTFRLIYQSSNGCLASWLVYRGLQLLGQTP